MKFKKMAAVLLATACVFTGCGPAGSSAAFVKVADKTVIETGYFNFVFHLGQVYYDQNYLSIYGNDMWNTDIYGNGARFEETIKSQTLDDLEDAYIQSLHYDEYGIALSDEDKAKMEEAIAKFESDNTKEALKAMGYKPEYLRRYLTEEVLGNRLLETVCEEVEVDVKAEDFQQGKMTYVFFATTYKTDADGNPVEADEAYVEEQKKKAEAMCVEGANFDELADSTATVHYTENYSLKNRDEGDYFEPVFKEADSLKQGEISKAPVLVENMGYYVVRKEADVDEEASANKVATEEQNQRYQHYYDLSQGWTSEVTFNESTVQYNKVKVRTIFAENPNATVDEVKDTATENTSNQ